MWLIEDADDFRCKLRNLFWSNFLLFFIYHSSKSEGKSGAKEIRPQDDIQTDANVQDKSDQTEVDDLIDNKSNEYDDMPVDETESPQNACLLHCNRFWATACTGICCCCPVGGDKVDGQVANSLDKRRRNVTCTDIPTLVIFLIVLLISIVISTMEK